MPKEVLVLGGGFAGPAAVEELARERRGGADIRVRLVDRRPYGVFYPLLPNLISGMVRPEHLTVDLLRFCRRRGAEFVQAEVRSLSLDDRRVETSAGPLRWDSLIVALGCTTNYFGRDEYRDRTLALHSVRDALAIATRATTLVEESAVAGDPEGRAHVLVVGGGYTGFEVAAEIAELIHVRTRIPYARLSRVLDIGIVEVADKVLPHSSDTVRAWVVDLVGRYGIRVATRTTVKELPGDRTVELSDGTVLRDAMVIWAPGVTPVPEVASLPVPKTRGHLLEVDRYLRLPGHGEAFAAGDIAGVTPPGRKEMLYMSVQFSLMGGRTAARNAVSALRGRTLKVFDPRDLGYVVPLAPGEGAGIVLGREVVGRLPYFLHFVMSTWRSWGIRNKVSVATDFILKRRMTEFEQRRRNASRW